MGANSSRQRYEYSYGAPPAGYEHYRNYNQPGSLSYGSSPYGTSKKKWGRASAAPYYAPAPGMMPMGYPPAYPQIIFPLVMHPMQQIAGPPVGQSQAQPQPQAHFQPPPQPTAQMPQPQVQPPVMSQMPQPQMPFSPSARGPPPPTQPLPGPQIPQPQMQFSPDPPIPQPQVQLPSQSQYPPQSTPAFASAAPPRGMSEPSVHDHAPRPQMPFSQRHAEGPAIPVIPSPQPNGNIGNAPGRSPMPQHVIPPSLTRAASDVLAHNPLPEPPRESKIPAHLLSGTAMTHTSPRPPPHSDPLKHPLPELPRDVYMSKKYRKLLVGSAYEEHKKEVYPDGWFAEERERGDGAAALGRAFARLNPFKPHQGHANQRGHRRHNTMPEPFEFARAGSTGSDEEIGEELGGRGQGLGRSFTLRMPFRRHRREREEYEHASPPLEEGPPVGFMPMPTPQVPVAAGGDSRPQPMHPLSPPQPAHLVAGQGPHSTPQPIRFNVVTPEYGGLSHLSPHRVLYREKLYPTAAHLLEAHKFLGINDELAERVRRAESLPELGDVVASLQHLVRRDWDEIVLDKMEDVLYRKFVQHEDMRNILLNTGPAELIYTDAIDSFWGLGPLGQGANELGRALQRIRERLRDEAAGR